MSSLQMLQSTPPANPVAAEEPVQRASDCLRFVSGEWLID